jgi:hypothetical protein
LSVLVPLIKEDLQQGNDAAKTASEPYYRAAGEKMIEAKSQMKQGEFRPWIKKHFGLSDTHASRYMAYARATSGAQNARFENFSDFMRKEGGDPTYGKVTRQQAWHEPVKESIERAKREAARIQEENLSRQREREEKIKLCFRMLDIGYKILSKELHPDKGGSREAMARLNEARKYAKAALA